MTTQIERVIPLREAAARTGISLDALTHLASDGKIRAVQLPSGEIAVSESEAARAVRKEELPEYKKHAHLRGVRTGIAEAARMHGLAVSTVQQWVQKGYIARVGQDGQKVLIDAADVAYCVEIYHKFGSRPGRRLFNPDGTPYARKTQPAA